MKQTPFSIDVLTVTALLLIATVVHAEQLADRLSGTEVLSADSGTISTNSEIPRRKPVENSRQEAFSELQSGRVRRPEPREPVLSRRLQPAGHCADFYRETVDFRGEVHWRQPPGPYCSRW